MAVILQNRLQGRLRDAIIASWSHAAGIFFWALAASSTLGSVFQHFPSVKTVLTLAGAIFLVYLAIQSWKSGDNDYSDRDKHLPSAWLSGLSISLLNPKIFVFFSALFSQFIPQGANLETLFGMAMVAGIVDGGWYSFVSLLVGRIGLEKRLSHHSGRLNRAAAVFYLVIACGTLSQLTGIGI